MLLCNCHHHVLKPALQAKFPENWKRFVKKWQGSFGYPLMINAWRSHHRLGPWLSPLRRSSGSPKLDDSSRIEMPRKESEDLPDSPLLPDNPLQPVLFLHPRQILREGHILRGVRHVQKHRKVEKRRVDVKPLRPPFPGSKSLHFGVGPAESTSMQGRHTVFY